MTEKKTTRKHRTTAQRIADAEAEIERLRQRELAQELRDTEEIRKAILAGRQVASVAQIAEANGDEALAEAAESARAVLSRELEERGLPPLRAPRKRAKSA